MENKNKNQNGETMGSEEVWAVSIDTFSRNFKMKGQREIEQNVEENMDQGSGEESRNRSPGNSVREDLCRSFPGSALSHNSCMECLGAGPGRACWMLM